MQPFKPLLAAAAIGLASGTAAAAGLDVKITGVEHDRGRVRVDLYSGPEGFRHAEKRFRSAERPAAAGSITARFDGLAPGRYAVVAYHDENGDGTMNRFMGMIPTEGYGLSNNPKVMGPPQFGQAAFELAEEGGAIEIRLNY